MGHGDYRKHNDGSMNSSTYHKRDRTPVRQLLKREAADAVSGAVSLAEAGAYAEDSNAPAGVTGSVDSEDQQR